MTEMFLTVEQAAERLQLSPVTIRRQIKSGVLKGIRRGRVYRIPESALSQSSRDSPASTVPGEIARRLEALDDLLAGLPDNRARAGLAPLSDEDIAREVIYGDN